MEERRIAEETVRVVAVAVGGWLALLLLVPDWATDAVLGFGAFYAVLACLVDENVQAVVRRVSFPAPRGNDRESRAASALSLGSRLRGNDIK